MATIRFERDHSEQFTQHWLNIDLDDGTSPALLRIARLTRRAPRRGIFGPGSPHEWEVWSGEGEWRFTSWPEAKAAIRRAIDAA